MSEQSGSKRSNNNIKKDDVSGNATILNSEIEVMTKFIWGVAGGSLMLGGLFGLAYSFRKFSTGKRVIPAGVIGDGVRALAYGTAITGVVSYGIVQATKYSFGVKTMGEFAQKVKQMRGLSEEERNPPPVTITQSPKSNQHDEEEDFFEIWFSDKQKSSNQQHPPKK